jgi:hypothetical protein
MGKAQKIEVVKIPINRQGYTSRGEYYGTGAPLYSVYDSESGVEAQYRASSAKEARQKFNADKDVQRKIADEKEKEKYGGITAREYEARVRNGYPLPRAMTTSSSKTPLGM